MTDRPELLDLDDLALPAWEAGGVDPALLTTPVAVASIGRRVRAVAFTKPLHDLEGNKVRLGGEAWAPLNMIELAFHAIDVVALRMDFDSGASYDDVVAAVASLAMLQVPHIDDPERVGERVVEGLITGRSSSDAEAHHVAFGSWGPDGYVARRYDFALVTEQLDSRGELHLRASDAAITVLVGALELDLSGSQQAAELRIQRLVERGLLDAAVHEAQTAKYRTIQYMEKLRRTLSAARLHATEAGTLEAVDRLVDHALEHVIERYGSEGQILVGVGRTRDEAEDEVSIRRANRLIDELRECQCRHQDLQQRLLTVRTEFRDAIGDQLAAPPNPPTRVDLERDLLRPVLELTLVAADQLAAGIMALSAAPTVRPAIDVDDLVRLLCTPPTANDGLGAEVDDGSEDLVEPPPTARFPAEVWDAIDAALAGVDGPIPLSTLLDHLGPAQPAAAHLLALRAFHLLDPSLGEALRSMRLGERMLVAAPVPDRIGHEDVVGDDLLLVPVTVTEPDGAVDGR